ncbi:polyprenyl synthetase family protein [Streptomyces sp. HNM0574]|uniref:polyprenyl synthetase family protein n=1 Tax=Streptomyces sp. HNM0574 TaxID=2714954 RepID=UPI00146B6F47|nr:polyprenyl synthetase family protein [Streptomyces sp. HNM0574]NLU71011.1 hypothetical protein [Streptomyces sp. HNM0574]
MLPEPASPATHPEAPEDAEAVLARTVPRARQYITGLLDGHLAHQTHLRPALARLLAHGRADPYELALPLLVHGALTGDPAPAVPVAAAHALWWRAANTFDDVADGGTGAELYGMHSGAALTAALECGYALPLRALAGMPAPGPVREALTRTYLDGWTAASNGQLGDLQHRPGEATPQQVLDVYRDKSGAIYEMACTMAAQLATGCAASPAPEAGEDGRRVAGWRRFGQVLGMLAQFRNDEDDLHGGPGEDLTNQTPTYLLVHLLHSVPEQRREQALGLLREARSSEPERARLRAMMTDPEVLRPYHARLTALRDEAEDLLGTLAPGSPFAAALRTRVHHETRFLRRTREPEPG